MVNDAQFLIKEMCVIIKKQCKPRTDGRRCTQCTLRSIFTGWYADKELTTKISDIKMIGNKTVYAGWKAAGVPDMLNGMIQWSDNADTSKWYYLAVQDAANSHYDDIKSDHHEKWTKLRDTRDWTQLEK